MTTKKLFKNLWIFLNHFLQQALQGLGLCVVWTYRLLLSPFLGGQCRFSPSCSCYAEQALKTLPIQTAVPLIIKRLAQCRPGGTYGLDPVPTSVKGFQP